MAYDPNPSSGVGVLVARAFSSSNVVLSSGLIAGASVGGVTLVTGDIVLLGGQTIPAENGIYAAVASGAASRSSKMAAASDASGVQIFVQQGSNTGTTYQQVANPAIVGTNSLSFSLQSQGSFAEFGGQTFTGGAWTNVFGALTGTVPSTGSQITLPSAGTYLITGQLDASSANTSTQMLRLFNVTTSAVVGTPATMTGDSAAFVHQGSATINAQVTTTSPGTVVRLEAQYNQLGIANTGGSIYYQKIGGTSAVLGSSVDYAKGIPATGGVGSASPFLFNAVVGSIPYAAGVFTLQAGKTYKLFASLLINTSGAKMNSQWRNLTSATLIGNVALSVAHNLTTFGAGSQTIAEAIITPTVTTTVQLENTTGASISTGLEGTVFIQQLGSSAITQFVGATGTVAGAGGFVPAPAATDNVNFLRGDGTFASIASASAVLSTALTAYTALTSDYHIRLTAASLQTLTLPPAASNSGRSYRIANPSIWVKAISSIVDETGTAITYVLDGESFVVTSDGTSWYKTGGFSKSMSRVLAAPTGSYTTVQVSIGGLTFSMGGSNVASALAVLQAKTVDGSTMNCTATATRITAASTFLYELLNPSLNAGTTNIHSTTTAFVASYQPFHLLLVDRLDGRKQWVLEGFLDGNANFHVSIRYTRF